MVELWKIKREALRVWFQFSDKMMGPYDWFKQKRYDANFERNIQVTNGTAEIKKKVAIFFVYQPSEFSKSILVSCEYLINLGYSVIIVSSSPLSDSNRISLAKLCWKVVERPNYGYDFGGYRDGIRVMREAGVEPEMLIIVNDSIWFPINSENQMVNRFETADLDFNSPVFEKKTGRNKKNHHFQSYFTFLKNKAVQSTAFTDYWRNYRVSSKKRIVLLRGEKGFSQAMFKAGFGGDMPPTRTVLFGLLQNQTNDFLRKTLEYAAYDDKALLSVARALLKRFSNSDTWRQDALFEIKKALDKTQPMGVFSYAAIMLLDFSFLKKSSYPIVHDGMRWQYLRAVKNGDLPSPHPDILAEIMASKMDPTLTTDPSIPTPISTTKAK